MTAEVDAPEVEAKPARESVEVDDAREIPPNECMFCGELFGCIGDCELHLACHGFRVCWPGKVKDHSGLMRYLREKIGIGNMCLFCNRSFRTLRGTRRHMHDKSHCAYERTEELDEFYEPETAVAVLPVDMAGELHAPSGTIYGHRAFARYYRQRLTEPDEIRKRCWIPIAGPSGSRRSVDIAADAAAQSEVYREEHLRGKRERRLVSRDYHPFADQRRGNA